MHQNHEILTTKLYSLQKDLEIIAKRLEVLADAESYQETYFSKDWINKNILGFDENQINLLDEQRKLEAKEPEEEQAEEEALDDEEEMDQEPRRDGQYRLSGFILDHGILAW